MGPDVVAVAWGEEGEGRLKLNRLARNLSNSEKLLLPAAAASSWNDLWEEEGAALADDIGERAE